MDDMKRKINPTPSFNNQLLLEDLEHSKYNAVILGPAGCGKSFLIKQFRKNLNMDDVILCAPTGTAAKNIGGQTIHRAFNIKRHRKVKYDDGPEMERLRIAKVLIIDEISMVSVSIINLIDRIARYARNKYETPFGGLRVLMFGDLKQLPPVPDEDVEEDQRPDICFYNSDIIKQGQFKFYELRHNYRQENDTVLQKILTEFRQNSITDESLAILNRNFHQEISFNPDIRYLTATNRLASYINMKVLQKQEGELFEVKREVYYEPEIKDSERHYSEYRDCLGKEKIPIIVHFKKDCPIMFFKNDSVSKGEMKYTNGTMGIVREVFCDESGFPEFVQIELEDKKTILVGKETFDFDGKWDDDGSYFHLGSIKQFPFDVAFATTIDKSQGQTLNKVAIVLGRRPRPNLVYVAISRIQALENLVIEETPITRKQIIMSESFETFMSSNNIPFIPVF